MRRALACFVLLVIGATLYIASPFRAAWALREAIRTGDSATLERKVEWDSVRASLKASLAKHAQLVPEISATEEAFKPGFWQRVKIAFGQSMIDSFVESYVTPAGLPKLLEARKAYSARVRREPEQLESTSPIERFKAFWARLKRAEFQSLTRVEIQIEDRRNPERHYVSVMELKDFEWRLTGLGVVAAPARPVPEPIGPREAQAAPGQLR